MSARERIHESIVLAALRSGGYCRPTHTIRHQLHEVIPGERQMTTEEWQQACDRLRARGLINATGFITQTGRQVSERQTWKGPVHA